LLPRHVIGGDTHIISCTTEWEFHAFVRATPRM